MQNILRETFPYYTLSISHFRML